MTRPIRTSLIVLAVGIIAWLGYARLLRPHYLTPRGQAYASIQEARTKLADDRSALQDKPRVQAELRRYIDRTLGGDLESVDARLRARLNRLVEQHELKNENVRTSGKADAKLSPARTLMPRSLQNEVDFCEVEATVTGVCTLEHALGLVDAIEREPWIKRIDLVKLDPRDNGDRINVTIRLTTLFLPRQAPHSAADHGPANTDPADALRMAKLVQLNPFRVPPPPARPRGRPVEVAAEPVFPYEQWTVTGVAQSGLGVEIWLLNLQTRESRRLIIGESLHEATLIAAAGEEAEFRVGEERFRVAVGASLNDRTPITQ